MSASFLRGTDYSQTVLFCINGGEKETAESAPTPTGARHTSETVGRRACEATRFGIPNRQPFCRSLAAHYVRDAAPPCTTLTST